MKRSPDEQVFHKGKEHETNKQSSKRQKTGHNKSRPYKPAINPAPLTTEKRAVEESQTIGKKEKTDRPKSKAIMKGWLGINQN